MLGLGNSLTSVNEGLERFLPTDISNLSLWFKNATGITGDPASQWADQSGNTNHMSQDATDGDQASVSEGGLLMVGANDDHYDLTTQIDIANQEGFSLFFVCKLTSSANNNTILSTQGVDHFIEFKNGAQIARIKLGGGQLDVTPSATTPFSSGTQFLFTLVREAGATGNILIYKNGSLLAQDSQAASNGDADFTSVGWGRAARTFNGIMHELIFYESALSGDDLTNVHSYLTGKFEL